MNYVFASDPRVIDIVVQARNAGIYWRQIPGLVTKMGFMSTKKKPFHKAHLTQVYLERYPEGRTNIYKNKPLYVKQEELKVINPYKLSEELLVRAITMRSNKVGWQAIENTFSEAGHRAPNGQPWHNANIAQQVLADPRGAHLRQRTYRKKRKYSKRKSNSRPKSQQKLGAGVLAKFGNNGSQFNDVKPQTQIEKLEAAGLTPSQIIAALKAK